MHCMTPLFFLAMAIPLASLVHFVIALLFRIVQWLLALGMARSPVTFRNGFPSSQGTLRACDALLYLLSLMVGIS